MAEDVVTSIQKVLDEVLVGTEAMDSVTAGVLVEAGFPAEPQTTADEADIRRRFIYYPPLTQAKVAAHQDVREAGYTFAQLVGELCPRGRERALALTKIEEAVHWANSALARESSRG
ncbi:MAG TPA: hypothetical protein VM285_14565 [Polyangia bacterium]|nr:hypothetical protein [Polyangia bacterium]